MERFRKFVFQNLAFGILAIAPILLSIYVFFAVLHFSDNFLFNLLPLKLRPSSLFGRNIPGLGIILTLAIIFSAGLLTRNFVGRQVLKFTEYIIARIPVVRAFYSTIRQFLKSIFMDRSDAFRKVILLEYPRKGLYTLAFVTSISPNPQKDGTYKDLYTVFVPTTPNPTSGFFLILPDHEAVDVNLSVQEAFRLIISGGVLTGSTKADIFTRIQKSLAKN